MKQQNIILTSNSSSNKKNNKFIDLSSFIYNREAHDKTMCVDVSKINFMIGIDSILNNNEDRNKLYQIIKSDYSTLFNKEFTKQIRSLNKEDFKRICNYHNTKDSFSGLEFYILKHLRDYHLSKFQEDMRRGNLSKIIKLCVSKGNLIVKVFPSKSTDDNPVSYTISLLYLVLMHLYKQLYQNKNIYSVIKDIFIKVTPIITIVTYSVSINADDNYSWFTQIQQLHTAYKFFDITKSKKQVRFIFRPREHYLISTLYYPVIHLTPSDTNGIARFIKCTYTLDKNNKLTCETTIVGKDMVDSVFATQIDQNNEPASLYSALSDAETLYLANYSIFNRILSFSKQHEDFKATKRLEANELVEQGRFKVLNTQKDKMISIITKNNTVKHAFKDIEITRRDNLLISVIIEELKKLRQKNNYVDYIIIALELMDKENNVINETLASLDERTSDKIKKVIKKIKKQKLTPGLTLNDFYRKY